MKAPAPGIQLEVELWQRGLKLVAGVDEAGRGALAGPVYAAAVVLPDDPKVESLLLGVRDSKLMTANQREKMAGEIKNHASGWGVGFSSTKEINEMGILPATRQAMWRAIQNLPQMPDFLLMDFIHWPGLKHPHKSMPKGESLSLSIAAASVLAKTARDARMREMDGEFPGYELAQHKGYGTTAHCAAIARLGPMAEHRTLFVRNVLAAIKTIQITLL